MKYRRLGKRIVVVLVLLTVVEYLIGGTLQVFDAHDGFEWTMMIDR